MSLKFEFDGDLDELKSQLRGRKGTEKRLVERSLPLKGEQLKMHLEMRRMVDETKALLDKMEAGKKKFWATVELDMDDFSTDKRINTDTNEIEILVDEDEENQKGKPIPSPFQTRKGK